MSVVVNDNLIDFQDKNHEFENDYPNKFNVFWQLIIHYAGLLNILKSAPKKSEIITLFNNNLNIHEILNYNSFAEKYY